MFHSATDEPTITLYNDDSGNYTSELLQKTVKKVREVRSDDKMEIFYMMWQLKLQDTADEAREEGRMEEKTAFAQKLLKRNKPIDEIVEDTELSHEEIRRLCTNA